MRVGVWRRMMEQSPDVELAVVVRERRADAVWVSRSGWLRPDLYRPVEGRVADEEVEWCPFRVRGGRWYPSAMWWDVMYRTRDGRWWTVKRRGRWAVEVRFTHGRQGMVVLAYDGRPALLTATECAPPEWRIDRLATVASFAEEVEG